jgi:hypothetical protein
VKAVQSGAEWCKYCLSPEQCCEAQECLQPNQRGVHPFWKGALGAAAFMLLGVGQFGLCLLLVVALLVLHAEQRRRL